MGFLLKLKPFIEITAKDEIWQKAFLEILKKKEAGGKESFFKIIRAWTDYLRAAVPQHVLIFANYIRCTGMSPFFIISDGRIPFIQAVIKANKQMSNKTHRAGGVQYLRAVVALGGEESTAMVWERCSPNPWLLLGETWREF